MVIILAIISIPRSVLYSYTGTLVQWYTAIMCSITTATASTTVTATVLETVPLYLMLIMMHTNGNFSKVAMHCIASGCQPVALLGCVKTDRFR